MEAEGIKKESKGNGRDKGFRISSNSHPSSREQMNIKYTK